MVLVVIRHNFGCHGHGEAVSFDPLKSDAMPLFKDFKGQGGVALGISSPQTFLTTGSSRSMRRQSMTMMKMVFRAFSLAKEC